MEKIVILFMVCLAPMPLSRVVESEIIKTEIVESESIESRAMMVVSEAGAEYVGIQNDVDDVPRYILLNDITGSTLAVDIDADVEEVREEIKSNMVAFGVVHVDKDKEQHDEKYLISVHMRAIRFELDKLHRVFVDRKGKVPYGYVIESANIISYLAGDIPKADKVGLGQLSNNAELLVGFWKKYCTDGKEKDFDMCERVLSKMVNDVRLAKVRYRRLDHQIRHDMWVNEMYGRAV